MHLWECLWIRPRTENEVGVGVRIRGWVLGRGDSTRVCGQFALNYKQLQLPIAAKQTKNKQKQDTAQKNVKIPKKNNFYIN